MLTRLSVEYEGLRVFWYDLLGLEAILGEHSISKTVISKFGFQGTNLNLLFFNACLIRRSSLIKLFCQFLCHLVTDVRFAS